MRSIRTIAAGAAAGIALAAGSAQAVEIEYWQYFFEARVNAMDALIEAFEEQNPDITVRQTHSPLRRLSDQGRRGDPGGRRAGRGPAVSTAGSTITSKPT